MSGLLLNGFQADSFPISAEDFHAVLALLGEKPDGLGLRITRRSTSRNSQRSRPNIYARAPK
jgi:hypothetical protein